MDGEQLHITIGRIEQKVDNVIERLQEQHNSLFGIGGLEPRIRSIEQDLITVKTEAASEAISQARNKAGWISFVVSSAVGGLLWLLDWLSHLKH